MASFLTNLDKQIKDWHILTLLGLLVLGYVIYQYSGKQNRILNNYQGPNLQNINPSTVGSVKASTNVVQDGAVKQSSVSAMDPMRDSLNGPSMISQVSSNTIAPIPSVPGNNLVTQLNPADLLPSNTASPGLVGMNNLLNSMQYLLRY